MTEPDELYAELLRLRGGRGVERLDLAAHLGPRILQLSEVSLSDSHSRLRYGVATLLRDLMAPLPDDVREVAEVAFALQRDYLFPTLGQRTQRLARDRQISERTARRMLDQAARTMVREAQARAARPPAGAGPGWRVTSLATLFRLDTPGPELYEMRRIVAGREVGRITVRLGLPPAPDPALDDDLVVEVLFGARLVTTERAADGSHLRIVLDLPRVLPADEAHEFWLRVVLPPGHPTWSHCAIVPLNPCDSGTVRVRFAPDRRPAAVWLLDEVPYLEIRDRTPGRRIHPDQAGDVERHFRGLREGYGYGIAWTLPTGPHAHAPV